MNLEKQGMNSWLFSLMWGEEFCFQLQHAEATLRQTILNSWLIYLALPAKICMHLMVLGQALMHNLGSGWWGNSVCLGTKIGVRCADSSLTKRMEEEKSLWAVWDNLTWELWQARTSQQIVMFFFLRLIFTFSHDTFTLGWKEEEFNNFSLFSFFSLIPSSVLDPVDLSFWVSVFSLQNMCRL